MHVDITSVPSPRMSSDHQRHVALIHQHFKLPEEPGSHRSYYIVRYLLQKGLQVTVICGGSTTQVLTPEPGLRLWYIGAPYQQRMGFYRRMKAFLSFAWKAYFVLKKILPSWVYVMSTPLTTALPALLLHRLYRIPYIFEAGDLWPKVPIAMGWLRDPLSIQLAKRLENRAYLHANKLIAFSPPIAYHMKQQVPQNPVHILYSFSDISIFKLVHAKPNHYRDIDLQGRFVIAYTGSMGMANQLNALLDLARETEYNAMPVSYLVAGSGAETEDLKREKTARNLRHVHFFEPMSKKELQKLYAACDAVYASFGPWDALYEGCPNKIFDGMAAGKFIMINFTGWLREFIEEEGIGAWLPAHNPRDSSLKVNELIGDPHRVLAAQRKARMLAETRFSPEAQLPGWWEFINR